MKVVVAAFNQKKALVGPFSVIVQHHRLIVYRALKSYLSASANIVSPSVTKLALDFPASPMIATVGADIVASADPTCSDAEKASLVTAEAGLEEAAAAVEDAYNEAQVSLMCVNEFLRYFLNIRGSTF